MQKAVAALTTVAGQVSQLATTLTAFLDAQMREIDKAVGESRLFSEHVAVTYEAVSRASIDDMAPAPVPKQLPKASKGGTSKTRPCGECKHWPGRCIGPNGMAIFVLPRAPRAARRARDRAHAQDHGRFLEQDRRQRVR